MADHNSSTVLEIRNLTKRFGDMIAVDNVSFFLENG
jgi:ABC-type branched-subunit amino acid transport system ATPase component